MTLTKERVMPRSPASSQEIYTLCINNRFVRLRGKTADEAMHDAQTRLVGKYFTEERRRRMRITDAAGNTVARLYCLTVKEWNDDFSIGQYALVFVFFFATSHDHARRKAREIGRTGMHRLLEGPEGPLDD
jgi:hypothetical protein